MTEAHPSDSLMPCPFCGSNEHLATGRIGSAVGAYYPYAVRCRHLDCDEVQGPTGNGEHDAIALWNRRTSDEHKSVALNLAADTFARYAELHWAKGTKHATAKGDANYELAKTMRAALAAPGGEREPVTDEMLDRAFAGTWAEQSPEERAADPNRNAPENEAEPVAWRPDRAALLKVLHAASVPAPVGRAYIVPTELIPVLADAILALRETGQ